MLIVGGDSFGVNFENDVLQGGSARQRESKTSAVKQNQVKPSLIMIMLMIMIRIDEDIDDDSGAEYEENRG